MKGFGDETYCDYTAGDDQGNTSTADGGNGGSGFDNDDVNSDD